MMKILLSTYRNPPWVLACLLFLGISGSIAVHADLIPPAQDYYLHTNQRIHDRHELAWVETPGSLIVTNALTVEAWVYWEGTDLTETDEINISDRQRMTLFCGQHAYGFYHDAKHLGGWVFMLQTGALDSTELSGPIPLPLREWAHLAASWDGTTIKTYLNGVQQSETALSGIIPVVGDAFEWECSYTLEPELAPASDVFGVGLGHGFTGGIRQLRVWNRALAQQEILDNASIHLEGTEPGLVSYWPLNGPLEGSETPNKVAGGPPLTFQWQEVLDSKPQWRLSEPLFEVREDLAEDVLVTDCPSLYLAYTNLIGTLIDVQNDGDQDLVFAGPTGDYGTNLTPFRALIRDGENGFIFDTAAAIAGTVPSAGGSAWLFTGDLNGDGREDVFSSNYGEDWFTDTGAPNTLLLSRPDGRLEDASENLLGPPCTSNVPLFEGQHPCFLGGGEWGRTPGVRYPGPGDLVPPDPDSSSSGYALGDTDGDGDLDILVDNTAFAFLEPPYMLINDGQGKFEANWQLLPDYMYDLENPAVSGSASLVDMDGDGRVDLVANPTVTNRADPFNSIKNWVGGIFWNDGSGDFSSADNFVIVPTPGIPNFLSFGVPVSQGAMLMVDIDSDGDRDLLISWGPETIHDPDKKFRSSLQILVNKGGRVFVDETIKRIGVPPQAGLPRTEVHIFYAEDFNNDGCLDLMFPVWNFDSTDTVIWLNNCHGYFSPLAGPVLPQPGGHYLSYLPLDYDGDGDIDLISSNSQEWNFAGAEGCGEDEGEGSDYIDFSVLLNVNPTKFKSTLIIRDGFEN